MIKVYSLFLDTHDKNIIEVLYKDGNVLDKNIRLSERNHSDYTMPMLDELLKRNKITPHDLGEILICNGPGSFTGVRIGVTIAKTLAYTLGIPIKTISSLDCLALSAKIDEKKVAIIKDIKGVFGALYESDNALIDGPFYKDNKDFKDYIESQGLTESQIIEETDYDYDAIYVAFKNIKETRAHEVKPLYIKVIEALKND